MSQILKYPFFLNLNKKGLSFLKKILIIFKINLLVITLFTSSAQATTSFVDSFSINAQETAAQGIAFNNDGTKMFVVGSSGVDVNEYTLTTGFDVSSASFVDSFSVSDQETFPTGVTFNNDGTKMFVVGVDGDVNEYTLTAGFDVSSASFVDSFSIIAQENFPTDVTFNNDGTKMFVVGSTGDDVNEYTLTTGFDVSSASFVDSFSVKDQESFPRDVTFNNDGTKMFVVGRDGDDVNEYTLTVAFDLNTNVLPTLSSSVPADNASNVARDANIVLNFSESVTVQSGNITIKKTSDNSTVETFNVATSGQITGTGTSQITINPSLNFDAETEYYVLIDATAFDDVEGGSYAGISNTTALSFTTVDNILPTLSSSSPADNATDVARDANIILNFSESVTVQTGNITVKKTSDDITIETIDVTSGQVTGTGTSQITINPSSDLFGGLEYYVLIDATAFDDSSNNSYAGISSTTALSFTVVDMQNPTTNKDIVGSIDSQSNISKNYAQQSINVVSGRLKYLRENVSNSNLSSKNIQLDFFGNTMINSLSEAIQVANKSSKITTPKEWSSWSEGLLVLSKTGDNGNSSSFEVDTQGVAIGFDKKLNEKDSIGYAIQFAQSDSEIGSSGSSIDSENLNISFYRSNPLDNDNFIEGIIGFGLLEKDLIRKSGSNILTGSRNGAQVFGSINFGKKIDKGDLTLTPVARLDLAYTELSAYSETGTDALSYSKQTIESGLASIGLEINNIIKFNNSSLKPFGSAEYSLDFSNSSDAKMNYTSDTSTTYTYKQGINSNHFISSEIGFEYMISDKLNIIASYMRNQGNESQHSDQVKLQVNYRSKKETDYAMTLSGSGDLSTGFDISKNLNGFDLNFNANQSLNESSNRAAEVSLSRKF